MLGSSSDGATAIIGRDLGRGTVLFTVDRVGLWEDVAPDTTLAAALLDRLLHHSHVLSFKGESYSLRGKTRGNV